MKYAIHLETVVSPECSVELARSILDHHGWVQVHRFTKEQSTFCEEIWERENTEGAFRIIEDDFMGVTILRAESNLDGRVATLLQGFESWLDFFYLADLVDLASAEEPATRSFGMRGMAAIAADFDGDVFRELTRAARAPDPRLRGLALRCIARYPWFRFAEQLDAIATTETVPELLAEQRALAEDLRSGGLRGT